MILAGPLQGGQVNLFAASGRIEVVAVDSVLPCLEDERQIQATVHGLSIIHGDALRANG
jgi:hypothetical protein